MFAAAVANRGEVVRVALAVEDGSVIASPVRPVISLTTSVSVHVHLLEGLLNMLHMMRGVTHQHRALPEIAAQDADLIVGSERSRERPRVWSCWIHWQSKTSLLRPGTFFLWRGFTRFTSTPCSASSSNGGIHRRRSIPGDGLDAAHAKPRRQRLQIGGQGAE